MDYNLFNIPYFLFVTTICSIKMSSYFVFDQVSWNKAIFAITDPDKKNSKHLSKSHYNLFAMHAHLWKNNAVQISLTSIFYLLYTGIYLEQWNYLFTIYGPNDSKEIRDSLSEDPRQKCHPQFWYTWQIHLINTYPKIVHFFSHSNTCGY